MGAEINLNEKLGEVGDTRTIRADGHVNLTQGKGLRHASGSVVGAGSTTTDATVTRFHNTLITSTITNGGIRFDSFTDGEFRFVKNIAGAAVKVYPPTSGTMDNSAANGSLTLNSGIGAAFFAVGGSVLSAIKGS